MTILSVRPTDPMRRWARYESDPEALAWARWHVQRELAALQVVADRLESEGLVDRSHGLHAAVVLAEQGLVNGGSDHIAAFDERLPALRAVRSVS